MPPSKKRKTATRQSTRTKKEAETATEEEAPEETTVAEEPATEEPVPATDMAATEEPVPATDMAATEKEAPAETAEAPATAEATPADRMARFRALQARAKASTDDNLQAAAAETQRLAAGDVSQLGAVRRKQAVAAHNLLRADVEAAGEDFERKRAWDWTAEESARWDKRVRKKAAHRDNNAFQDYRQEAHKVYKRQVRGGGLGGAPDLEQYTRDKLAAVERAAAEGGLEIVETADGELVAVDRDGTYYGAAATGTDATAFADNRPSREAVDRLVRDQKQAEEASLRKRRERMAKNGDDGDVTYINEKNKQFNMKLARFYNKYTAEIRESFERGTMI